jgi:hypothetical protein
VNLENVKAGDFIAIYSYGSWNGNELSKALVKRATKTMVETEHQVFNRHGRKRGGSHWDRVRAEPWNEDIHGPELLEQNKRVKHRVLCSELNHVDWMSLPLEVVERIYSTVKEERKTSNKDAAAS